MCFNELAIVKKNSCDVLYKSMNIEMVECFVFAKLGCFVCYIKNIFASDLIEVVNKVRFFITNLL